MRKVMFSFIIMIALLFVFNAKVTESAAPSNFPKPPSKVCYAFTEFATDFIIISINPGQRLVTGVYRVCVPGSTPGTGSADALMVGTIQDVAEGSTIPYAPFNSEVITQIALQGSIASGNFGDGNEGKASQCWLHLVFEDNAMTMGTAIGACEYFNGGGVGGPLLNVYDPLDRFFSAIVQIDCDQVLTLDGTCTPPE